ncbi:unnamed protein product [Sphenostylis stenocarpa]|uniref:Uncharacterized protein n=1 Tax=Sphenostylis stenocarpa TaxID=92480 RepID=A0AA87B8Z5_9FABA|nr:unnamed protein product [Sphenostylis stenocarpa]
METTSLRGLAFVPLLWAREGVGVRTVPVLAEAAISVAAMAFKYDYMNRQS